MSNPEHLSRQCSTHVEIKDRRVGYPAPDAVVQAALATLRPDGSVIIDTDTDEPFVRMPNETVDLDILGVDSYRARLAAVARVINGAVSQAGASPAFIDSTIQGLATYLSAYRHDLAFIDYAASLSTIDQHGALCGPTLPHGDPRVWVPELRTHLAYQNEQRESRAQT